MLAFAMFTMVITLPRVLATAWVSLGAQTDLLADYWSPTATSLAVLARMIAILALVLPIAGIAYILIRLVRQVAAGVWTATAGRPLRRGLAVVTAMALVAGLALGLVAARGDVPPGRGRTSAAPSARRCPARSRRPASATGR